MYSVLNKYKSAKKNYMIKDMRCNVSPKFQVTIFIKTKQVNGIINNNKLTGMFLSLIQVKPRNISSKIYFKSIRSLNRLRSVTYC